MTINFNKNFFRKFLPGIIAILFVSVIFNSCETDPVFLGRDILPPGDDINTYSDTTAEIQAWTVTSRPVITTLNELLIIGSRYDSVFGYTKAEGILPLLPITSTNPGTNLKVDSVRLDLIIDRYYGQPTTQTIRVYEMNTPLKDVFFNVTDTTQSNNDDYYYSDFDPEGQYFPEELGSTTFTSKPDTIRKDTISIMISDPRFLEKFETASNERVTEGDTTYPAGEIYTNLDMFIDYFPGFYITTDPVNSGGSMMVLDSLLNDSRLSLYYQSDSTVNDTASQQARFSMGFSMITNKVNIFHHDHTGYPVERSLNDSTSADTLLFIMGTGGYDVRLSLSTLAEELKEQAGKIAINKAELILPVEKNLGIEESIFPRYLRLLRVTEDGSYTGVYDEIIDGTGNLFGGKYTEDQYIFNIGRHLQAYLDGDIDELEFIIRPSHTAQSLSRTVLKGQGSKGQKMKLILVYTEL